jgi:hypothetical protein
MKATDNQYDNVVMDCETLFVEKMKDYGSAWRVLRLPSLTDQIFIKAQRIRSIEVKGTRKIAESIKDEFIGIVNYSIMALIQVELGPSVNETNMPLDKAIKYYKQFIGEAKMLMQDKNHDYSEAWRDMRISSLTDIILMKLFRIKQIEDNKGVTKVSEGVNANYFDIINYAVFALIKIDEEKSK